MNYDDIISINRGANSFKTSTARMVHKIISDYAYDLLIHNNFFQILWPIIHNNSTNTDGIGLNADILHAIESNNIKFKLMDCNLKIDLRDISLLHYKSNNGFWGDLIYVSCWIWSKNPKLEKWIITYGKTFTSTFFIPDQFIDFAQTNWPKTYKEFKELVNLTIL